MLDFSKMKYAAEPPHQKLSLEEYLEFCEFCLRNNPSITPENCMQKNIDEAGITVPFKI